jgi:hypothetical protein
MRPQDTQSLRIRPVARHSWPVFGLLWTVASLFAVVGVLGHPWRRGWEQVLSWLLLVAFFGALPLIWIRFTSLTLENGVLMARTLFRSRRLSATDISGVSRGLMTAVALDMTGRPRLDLGTAWTDGQLQELADRLGVPLRRGRISRRSRNSSS